VKDRGADFVKGFDEELRRRLKFLDYAPVLHLSAATGERAPKLLEAVDRVAAARLTRVADTQAESLHAGGHSRHTRRPVPLAARSGSCTPRRRASRRRTSCSSPTSRHRSTFSYERFLVNQLRHEYGFIGSPIRLQVRRRGPAKKRSS